MKLVRITTVPISLKILLMNQMKFMQQQKNMTVLMVSADGPEIEAVLKNEACPHTIIPFTRTISPLQDLKCLWQLTMFLRREKPDIVHTHTPKAGLIGMMAAWLARVPVKIHTVAGMPLMVESGNKRRLLEFTEKLTYFFADEVWPNAYSLLRFIQQHKFTKAEKLRVISKGSSNGILVANYTPENIDKALIAQLKTTIKYDASKFYLVVIGRIVADKGIVELMEAFKQLQQAHPQLHLLLLGNYEQALDPLPQATLDFIQHNEAITHVPWTNHVAAYLSFSNLLIHASHREGFPNVLLQAGAMHVPMVVSDIDGNNDIVTHQKTGLLFKVTDTADIIAQVNYAIENPIQLNQMAEQLQQEIRLNYSQAVIHEAIYENYQRLLKSKK